MDLSRARLQFSSLYTMRFAGSFGFITVLTLLPDYIDALGATGITIGVFVTALELARTIGIVPIAWAGDRYSKRTILLVGLVTSVLAYAAFAVITSIDGFLGARLLQGLGMTGVGLLGLAVIGDLAPASDRANYIGKYNAFRMAGGGLAPLAAGGLFALTGFSTVFVLVAVIMGAVLAAIVLNGLLGAADAFREPASMALFADEGKGEGIASSIGIRSLLWKPGSILAPLLAG
nr:MFS transporter [Halorhabdus salina]